MTPLHFTNQVDATLIEIIEGGSYNRVAVLVDSNTRLLVLPRLGSLDKAFVIEIPAGDINKNLDSLTHVWEQLQRGGMTRQSLLLNLGGGVVTDLGGLAAATFKRGISFVNVPTTLLGAVDAAVGGKTGINFGGLKNEIGVFAFPEAVIVSTCFFSTLPRKELLSGFAEMLKHAMLHSESQFEKILNFDLNDIDFDLLLDMLQESLDVKKRIVEQDPTEQGLRKALNFGHTVAHAFESKAMNDGSPIPHGYAVAWGLVVETVLSHMLLRFSSEQLYRLAAFVKTNYGAFFITCDHYDKLIDLMRHDKKSIDGEINCTLLSACGDPKINNTITPADIKAALDIYRDLMGI